MSVRHVLLDADGVLQSHPLGFVDAARELLGGEADEAMVAAYASEAPYLCAPGDFPAALAERLRALGVTRSYADLHRTVWLSIEVDPPVVDLVRRLRRAGLGVHLTTNQHQHRAAYMRAELGYDELFDTSWYSWEVGAAKPDPAYFRAVVDGLGVEPAQCLFVDDRADNVESARAGGLRAERWTTADGHLALDNLLAAHGVAAPGWSP